MYPLNKSFFTVLFLVIGALFAQAQPFITGNALNDNLVKEQQWSKVENLSDEFTGNSIDKSKWDTRSIIPGRFHWVGRWPGLFEAENIHLQNDELWLEAELFDSPKTDELNGRDDWTHGGAIVRSHGMVERGMYVEAKMRTTETIMSGTFWLTTPISDCNVVPKAELDVTESIGRKSGVFKQPELGWYANVADNFEFGVNATCRQRSSNCLPQINQGGGYGNFDPSEYFHVYGLYWESPTDIHFYLDGQYRFSITPPMPFAHPMAIIMALETYDFNWPSTAAKDGFEGTLEERSTKYKWVRTWQLNNTTSIHSNKEQKQLKLEIYPNPTTNGQMLLEIVNGGPSSQISILGSNGSVLWQTVSTAKRVELATHSLPSGFYLVKVETGGKAILKKIVIN
ncbi:MAG: T9SS type A sorting domain-containing protein [Bacteroidota bacterium]